MKKCISLIIAIACLIVIAGVVIWRRYPVAATLILKDETHTVVETIMNHRLPQSFYAYTHTGKPELVVTKVLPTAEPSSPVHLVWAKVIDKGAEAEKGMLAKIKDKLSSIIRFLAFDENGALFITNYDYRETNELDRGDYTYLQTLRVELDANMFGTYIWEFPIYVDAKVPIEQRNQIVINVKNGSTVTYLQSAMSELDDGNGSKITNTENGVIYTGNQAKLTVEVKK